MVFFVLCILNGYQNCHHWHFYLLYKCALWWLKVWNALIVLLWLWESLFLNLLVTWHIIAPECTKLYSSLLSLASHEIEYCSLIHMSCFFVRHIHVHMYHQNTLMAVNSTHCCSVGCLFLQMSWRLSCIESTCMIFWSCNDHIRPMTFKPWALWFSAKLLLVTN